MASRFRLHLRQQLALGAVEEQREVGVALLGEQQHGVGIDFPDRRPGRVELVRCRQVDLVQHQHVRVLDLLLVELAEHLLQAR